MKLEDLDLGDMTPEELIQSVVLYELYTKDTDLWYTDKFSYVFKNNLSGKNQYKTFVPALKEIIREYNSRLAETSSK